MPTYEYHCASNDRRLEVQHKMSLQLHTWGELRTLAGLSADTTPDDAPVRKCLGTGGVISQRGDAAPACPRADSCPCR